MFVFRERLGTFLELRSAYLDEVLSRAHFCELSLTLEPVKTRT